MFFVFIAALKNYSREISVIFFSTTKSSKTEFVELKLVTLLLLNSLIEVISVAEIAFESSKFVVSAQSALQMDVESIYNVLPTPNLDYI